MVSPRCCVVCGAQLGLEEDDSCLRCESELPYTFFWTRRRNEMAEKINLRVRDGLSDGVFEPYSYAAALFFYRTDSDYKHIPVALKYGADLHVGRHYAADLADKLRLAPWFDDVDAVVSVPLHLLRRLRRGYNQAEVIGAEIARVMGVEFIKGALRRTRFTRSQTRVGAEARKANVSRAFKARRSALEGRHHVLLVDDTFTTGSTLYACIRALRSALLPGLRVSVVTLAYVGQ